MTLVYTTANNPMEQQVKSAKDFPADTVCEYFHTEKWVCVEPDRSIWVCDKNGMECVNIVGEDKKL